MPVHYFGYPEANPKERFQFWLDNPPSAVALDVETISLTERHPLGVGVAFSPQEALYFDLQPEPPRELELLAPLLENPRITKVAHNWLFDMGVFPLIPIIGERLERYNTWDTNIAARLLGYEETSLPILAFDVGMSTTGMGDILKAHGCKNNVELIGKDPMLLANHCQADVRVTYRLFTEWYEKVMEKYGNYFNVEMRVIPVLVDMSMRGIALDQVSRQALEDRYTDEVAMHSNIVRSFGVEKPSSPAQVGFILAKRGNMLKYTRKKKQYSTREGDLEFLDDPMASAVLHFRKKSKFLNTYLVPLKDEDRFYTEYYMDTGVGRLNSRNRNIQNIPGADKDTGDPGARFMLMPDSGLFTTGDYSREHMFILAQVSQDRDMMRVLYDTDPKKNDIHQYTADMMGVPRKIAKTTNYTVIYGATVQTLQEQLKSRDRYRCEELLNSWFKTFRGAADWIREAQDYALRTGWSLPTLFGRSIKIPEESTDGMRRKGANYPILGSDGEVIKRALILCDRKRLGPPMMCITVHDSITWDGDIAERLPIDELENIPGYRIPFEVKQTFRWE